MKAQVATSPAERKQYLEQAVLLQKQAMDLRKETQAVPRPAPPPTCRPRRPRRPRRSSPGVQSQGVSPVGETPCFVPDPRGARDSSPCGSRVGPPLFTLEGPAEGRPPPPPLPRNRRPRALVTLVTDASRPYAARAREDGRWQRREGPCTGPRRQRMVAGVCGGFAEWLGWDVTLVRIVYVAVSVCSAAFPGILVYLVLWILMPQAD